MVGGFDVDGCRCRKYDRQSQRSANGKAGIYFFNVFQGWVKNVKSINAIATTFGYISPAKLLSATATSTARKITLRRATESRPICPPTL